MISQAIQKLQTLHKRKHFIEDSIALRAVTTAMALTGVFAAIQLTDSPLWLILFSVVGCIGGSCLSYKRRYSNNFIVKIWLTIGILIVTGFFFNELLVLAYSNIADARVPLTKLLIGLIALHCFDLPRRRDLSVSALVGATLITASATLSRDLSFGFFVAIFMLLSMTMFQLDCASRSKSRSKLWTPEQEPAPKKKSIQTRKDIGLSFKLSATLLTLSLLCFALMPRIQLNFIKQLRLSGSLPYQIQLSLLSSQMSRFLGKDTSIRAQSNAYFGFSEQLDTNYRGELGDQVVLRVSCQYGTYLRGMAYDTYDGKVWRMSRPKQISEQLAQAGNSFDISIHGNSPRVDCKTISQLIYVEEDSSNLVVCASVPYQIYFPSESLQVDTYGGIRSPVGIHKDMVYTVFSRVPIFVYETLRHALNEEEIEAKSNGPKIMGSYLQLPDKLDPQVKALSKQVAGKGNSFVRAERLCNYLQRNLKYDINVETTPIDRDSVSDFLFYKKRGFCEHFASALVVMCRTQGIPARLVTGYQPGQFNPFTGLWDVRLSDAHSWAEVFVRKYGWVPMDPTPSSLMSQQIQDPQSVFAYIGHTLEPIWQNISKSNTLKSLQTWLGGFIENCLRLLLDLSKHFSLMFSLAFALAIVLSVIAFGKNSKWFLKLFYKSKDSTEYQQLVLEEASREFIALNNRLALIGITRKPYETADDLLERVRKAISAEQVEGNEYFEKLVAFMNLYSAIRFGTGSNSDLEQLKQLRDALNKMTETITEERKKQLISKSSC